jgi:hypothetical protein
MCKSCSTYLLGELKLKIQWHFVLVVSISHGHDRASRLKDLVIKR